MPAEHRLDRRNVPLRQPKPFGMFIHNVNVAVTVSAAQQHDGVMRESIIQRREPLPSAQIIKVLDDMHVAPEGRKELTRRNVPIPIKPRSFLPAREALQNSGVFRIVKMIVPDARGNESALGFLSLLERNNELLPIPGVT